MQHFEACFPGATRVELAGAHSGWRPQPARRTGDRWSLDVPLGPGLWPYRWVVDGQWVTDPEERLDLSNGLGGRDSVRVVSDLPPRRGLRAASLNLHCWQEADPDRKLEEAALSLAYQGVDVVALQEVGDHLHDSSRSNAGDRVAQHLRRWTGDRWDHRWEEAHLGFGAYREGLSLLARRGLERVRRISLSEGPLARVAVVGLAEGLAWACVHLSWGAAGATEARRLLDAWRPAPALVLGDLNGGPGSAVARAFAAAGFRDLGPPEGTFLATGERLDAVLARGLNRAHRSWRVLDGGGLGFPVVSDHAGLLVELGEAFDDR